MAESPRLMEMRRLVDEVSSAALGAIDPRTRTAAALRAAGVRRARILAVGKAAGPMAAGAVDALDAVVEGSFATVPHDAPPALLPLETCFATHPLPSSEGSEAGRRALATVGADAEPWVLCISGGASALWFAPAPPVTLREAQEETLRLLHSGQPIAEINAVRRRLSQVAGGGLALAARRPPELVVVLSDVRGDDPAVVGSGPCWPDQGSRPRHVLIGSNRLLVQAAVEHLRRRGFEPEHVRWDLAGPVSSWAARFRSARETTVEGGEPEVRVVPPPGRGGRCSHLALMVARDIAGRDDCLFAAIASDGVDGTSGSGGALVDGTTWSTDGADALAAFDSAAFLASRGALIAASPTGINVNDLYLYLLLRPPLRSP